jgi:hypothetical protein
MRGITGQCLQEQIPLLPHTPLPQIPRDIPHEAVLLSCLVMQGAQLVMVLYTPARR